MARDDENKDQAHGEPAGPAGTVLFTGMDCVTRILADTYAKQLMEQGIANKPLCWKPLKVHYACGYVSTSGFYILSKKDLRRAPGPQSELWQPAEVPQEIWRQAVQKFTRAELSENLLRHLFPLLGDLRNLVPYEELVTLVEKYLLEQGIMGQPLRKKNDTVYCFEGQGIYTSHKMSQEQVTKISRWELWHPGTINQNVWTKALNQCCEGTTLCEFVDLFLHTKLIAVRPNYSYLDRLVTRIERSSIERVPENENTNTFDRVRVYVNLSHTMYPSAKELLDAVRQHRREIDSMVLDQIQADRRFQRFGVPVNVLTLSALTFYNRTLEYIFELKEETKMQPHGCGNTSSDETHLDNA